MLLLPRSGLGQELGLAGTDRILEGLTKTLGQLVARQQTQEAQTRDDLNSEASDRQSLLDRANARLAIQREALAAQVGERASRFRALRECPRGGRYTKEP